MGQKRKGRDVVPYKWFVKRVLTYSKRERKIRLFRIVWARNGGPGSVVNGIRGWSSKLSLNLVPRLFAINHDSSDLYVTLFGIQIHKQTHFGGWIS